LAKEEKEVVVNQWMNLPSFKVKIPDIEIEFSSPDVKGVTKRFDEVLEYLKEFLDEKRVEEIKKR
jgi:hypothetical protein